LVIDGQSDGHDMTPNDLSLKPGEPQIVAEAELAWPDQRCAVVLTYDDYDAFQDDGWDVWLAGQPADRAIDGYALLDPQELLKTLSSHPVQT
jgi:hypothetical protein